MLPSRLVPPEAMSTSPVSEGAVACTSEGAKNVDRVDYNFPVLCHVYNLASMPSLAISAMPVLRGCIIIVPNSVLNTDSEHVIYLHSRHHENHSFTLHYFIITISCN